MFSPGLFRAAAWLLLLSYAVLALRFAWAFPAGPYFHDEKFNMENVEGWAAGEFRPRNSWYSPLTWVPQAVAILSLRALREGGLVGIPALFQEGRATDEAYRVARTVGVVYAVAALAVAWSLGSQLFGRGAALFGLAVSCGSPWVIRAGVEFKPDSALLLTSVLALACMLAARRRPSTLRFLLAGAAVGLAISAKLNAIFLALLMPVAVATAASSQSWKKRSGWLFGSALAALAAYLVTSPFLMDTLWYLGRIERHYARKGQATIGDMLWTALGDLASWSFLGPWVGALALVAAVYWVVRPLRHPEDVDRALFALSAILYLVLVSLLTRYYKPNHYPHLVPVLGILAGSLGGVLSGHLFSQKPAFRRAGHPIILAVGASLAVQQVWKGARFVYRETVPSVEDLVAAELKRSLHPLQPRIAWLETPPEKALLEVKSRDEENALVFLSLIPSPDLKSLGSERLGFSDALIFPRRRLHEPGGEAYRRWVEAAPPSGRKLIQPAFFRAWGESQVLLLRPWQPAGEALPAALGSQTGPASWKLDLPDLRPGTVVSLYLQIWSTKISVRSYRNGFPLPLFGARYHSGVSYGVTTERWKFQKGEQLEVHLDSAPASPDLLEAWFQPWTLPETPDASSMRTVHHTPF